MEIDRGFSPCLLPLLYSRAVGTRCLYLGFAVFTAYLWHAQLYITHKTGAEAPAYSHPVPAGIDIHG